MPKAKIEVTTMKRVTVSLSQEEVENIVRVHVQANIKEFNDTNVTVSINCGEWEGCNFSCTATGVRESTR